MDNISNIKLSLEKQKQFISDLETEIEVLSNSDIIKENQSLKNELISINEKHKLLENKFKTIDYDNKQLRDAVFQYTYCEKNLFINYSEKKSDVFFKKEENHRVNKLTSLEIEAKEKLKKLSNYIDSYNIKLDDSIKGEIDSLSQKVSLQINTAKDNQLNSINDLKNEAHAGYNELKSEPLTEEQIKSSIKSKNIENFLGLNLINRIGILLVVIGVFAASQYAYYKLTNTFKGILIFALGLIFLTIGEVIAKKNKSVFSTGFTAGGISILYIGLAVSFFNLKILPMYPALLICVFITGLAFFLSLRHNSQIISIFALFGGYLPFFTIVENNNLLMASMVYFLALHILVLLISFYKKWKVASFIGLFTNFFSVLVISTIFVTSYTFRNNYLVNAIFVTAFLFLSFGIYTAVPIISNKKTKTSFLISDLVFFTLNTALGSLIIFAVFYFADLDYLHGYLSMVFAIIYFVAAKLIEKYFVDEKRVQALFFITSLAFIVLTIPLQFNLRYLTLGWLLEGTFIILYGILNNEKAFKKWGFIVFSLCVLSFVFVDVLPSFRGMILFKYFSITLASILILVAYFFKNTAFTGFKKIYKYITIINLWMFFMYFIYSKINLVSKTSLYDNMYLKSALAIVVTFIYAFFLTRFKYIKSKEITYISITLYILGTISNLMLNSMVSPYYLNAKRSNPLSVTIISTVILVLLMLFVLFAAFDLMKLLLKNKFNLLQSGFILSLYFLVILTQNLIVHYNLAFTSIVISTIYALMAVIWIYFGFIKNLPYMRRTGLVFSLLTVLKLFILDLRTLTDEYRIISYFILGLSLILISYIYQRFDKKLELKTSIIDGDDKLNQ